MSLGLAAGRRAVGLGDGCLQVPAADQPPVGGRDGRPGGELMTPGSLLLGSVGRSFECRHEHGAGDRCLSFGFAPGYFERLAAAAGACQPDRGFLGTHRVPPLRALSPLVARACACLSACALTEDAGTVWEELGVRLAAQAMARVTRTVRMIERHPEARLSLAGLAQAAGLSPYHFLRVFEQVTGTTPHRYILATRLREAATRLAADSGKVVDIAFDCGFGDLSNFNRTFRAEFGVSPRAYQRQSRPGARGTAGFTTLSAHSE